jgi:hypothetical protein
LDSRDQREGNFREGSWRNYLNLLLPKNYLAALEFFDIPQGDWLLLGILNQQASPSSLFHFREFVFPA